MGTFYVGTKTSVLPLFTYIYIMKPVTSCLLFLALLCSVHSFGQGENNIWCSGYYVGVNFNAGPPVLYADSLATIEGSASVCDASGNLLFYASPEKVWNRNHHIMPNGNGLIGHISASQGAAIIQSFSNPDQYYLFTLQDVSSQKPRLHYSVIDMTLDNGLGDVVVNQKNIFLDSNLSEQMVVVKGAGCYNWLLVHERSNHIFHAFKVDFSGVSTIPAISNSGFGNIYEIGEMKISPNDSTIALGACTGNANVELHKFNTTTGTVSNAIELDPTINGCLYGISFSPDGSKLYTAAWLSNSGVSQYDISLFPDAQAVINSRVTISGLWSHGMRIGPDGKIYVVVEPQVRVINFPNLAGNACNFTVSNIDPSGYFSGGLGNVFIKNQPNILQFPSHDTSLCLDQGPVALFAPAGYNSYQWSDGNTSQSDTFSSACTKWVVSTMSCNIRIDTFHVQSIPISTMSFVSDTNVCLANNVLTLSALPSYSSYVWSDGNVGPTDTIGQSGTKWVRAQLGCDIRMDTFKVHDWRDTTKIITDTSHCVAYSPITIYAPGGYTNYTWSDGKTTQVDTFFATTTKWVRALNGCSLLIDTVHFTATTIPQDSITIHGTDTTICFENVSSVNVTAPGGYTYYLWNDGTPLQTDAFNGAGTKWVYAQKLCALLIDTFAVVAQGTDTTTKRIDTFICFATQATVDAEAGYLTYLWSDGNVSQQDTFNATTIKYVTMHRACEQAIDTFHLSFVNGLSVSLGNDTALCKGETIQLHAVTTYPDVAYLWQDNSTAAVYNASEGGDYTVKVSVGPCSVSDTVRIHQKVIDAKLGNGNVPCGNEELVLDAGVDSSSYLWQDGSKNRTFKATSDGEYSVKVTQGLCSTTAKVSVQFEACPCTVVIPTGFSPNGDGKNDQFGATVSCRLNSYKMMVYSRWGSRVFYSESVDDKWDGTVKGIAVDGDVYYYYLEFKDGENKVYYYKGDVTVVR